MLKLNRMLIPYQHMNLVEPVGHILTIRIQATHLQCVSVHTRCSEILIKINGKKFEV